MTDLTMKPVTSKSPAAKPSKKGKSPRAKRTTLGYFSTDPTFSGYENLVRSCRNCDSELVINRATELRSTYPSMGMKFRCPKCNSLLKVSGDVANGPVDQFVFDAYGPLLHRRYMQTVIMLSQSLELALVMCVETWIFGCVRIRRQKADRDAARELTEQFSAIADTLTLGALRRLAMALAIWQPRPSSLAEATLALESIGKLRSRKISAQYCAAIPDPGLRRSVSDLLATDFVNQRNAVVHKAHRPDQLTAERFYDEIPRLNRRLMTAFGVTPGGGQQVMPPRSG
ncbi:MAG: hypothetical protein ACYC7A_06720 [Thermoanaerobaculia bacterium]